MEPVRVVTAKTKKKGNIEIAKAFNEDDDWLDGFTVTVTNDSSKTVTALTIEIIFPREPGDTRPPVAHPLHFGPSPIGRDYIYRDPNKVIKIRKTIDLQITPEDYKNIKDRLQLHGYPNSIKRVELEINEVGFDDGSVLLSGTLYVQDPAHPNDPTKKLPVHKPPGGGHSRPINILPSVRRDLRDIERDSFSQHVFNLC